MSDYGKKIRLSRILSPHRGTLVVAFDHPLVLGPIPGTEDPAAKIRQFIEAKADAVLVNLGAIRYCAEHTSPDGTPGIIARLDWTTAYGKPDKASPIVFRSCLVARPEEALRLGADAVITNLVVGTGDADFEKSEVARVAKVARECERLGMPMMVESVARGLKVENPCDPKWLTLHTRMAAELGADAIKTEYTGDPNSMRKVVSLCPIPILVLGGGRVGSDEDALNVVRGIVESGAAGVFFGRNVFQADNMPEFLQRARAILGEPKRG